MTDESQRGGTVPERIREWLRAAVQAGASDLHLVAELPPVLRLHGDLVERPEAVLPAEELHELLSGLCSPEVLARLESQKNADFSFQLDVDGRVQRFRANLFSSG